jgi:hypothetical protein
MTSIARHSGKRDSHYKRYGGERVARVQRRLSADGHAGEIDSLRQRAERL